MRTSAHLFPSSIALSNCFSAYWKEKSTKTLAWNESRCKSTSAVSRSHKVDQFDRFSNTQHAYGKVLAEKYSYPNIQNHSAFRNQSCACLHLMSNDVANISWVFLAMKPRWSSSVLSDITVLWQYIEFTVQELHSISEIIMYTLRQYYDNQQTWVWSSLIVRSIFVQWAMRERILDEINRKMRVGVDKK